MYTITIEKKRSREGDQGEEDRTPKRIRLDVEIVDALTIQVQSHDDVTVNDQPIGLNRQAQIPDGLESFVESAFAETVIKKLKPRFSPDALAIDRQKTVNLLSLFDNMERISDLDITVDQFEALQRERKSYNEAFKLAKTVVSDAVQYLRDCNWSPLHNDRLHQMLESIIEHFFHAKNFQAFTGISEDQAFDLYWLTTTLVTGMMHRFRSDEVPILEIPTIEDITAFTHEDERELLLVCLHECAEDLDRLYIRASVLHSNPDYNPQPDCVCGESIEAHRDNEKRNITSKVEGVYERATSLVNRIRVITSEVKDVCRSISKTFYWLATVRVILASQVDTFDDLLVSLGILERDTLPERDLHIDDSEDREESSCNEENSHIEEPSNNDEESSHVERIATPMDISEVNQQEDIQIVVEQEDEVAVQADVLDELSDIAEENHRLGAIVAPRTVTISNLIDTGLIRDYELIYPFQCTKWIGIVRQQSASHGMDFPDSITDADYDGHHFITPDDWINRIELLRTCGLIPATYKGAGMPRGVRFGGWANCYIKTEGLWISLNELKKKYLNMTQ